MPDAPEAALQAAFRLRRGCRCSWTADDRNAVIAYLVAQGESVPHGFPLRLVQRGTSWWLEKV
jgi:hypothetical protein